MKSTRGDYANIMIDKSNNNGHLIKYKMCIQKLF